MGSFVCLRTLPYVKKWNIVVTTTARDRCSGNQHITRRRLPTGGGEERTDDNFKWNYRERPLATRTACPSEKCTFLICIFTIINAREVVHVSSRPLNCKTLGAAATEYIVVVVGVCMPTRYLRANYRVRGLYDGAVGILILFGFNPTEQRDAWNEDVWTHVIAPAW